MRCLQQDKMSRQLKRFKQKQAKTTAGGLEKKG